MLQSIFTAILALFVMGGLSGGIFFLYLVIRCLYREDEFSSFVSAMDAAPLWFKRRKK